jgi:hypothetical protein
VSAKHISWGDAISSDFNRASIAAMEGSQSCCHHTRRRRESTWDGSMYDWLASATAALMSNSSTPVALLHSVLRSSTVWTIFS